MYFSKLFLYNYFLKYFPSHSHSSPVGTPINYILGHFLLYHRSSPHYSFYLFSQICILIYLQNYWLFFCHLQSLYNEFFILTLLLSSFKFTFGYFIFSISLIFLITLTSVKVSQMYIHYTDTFLWSFKIFLKFV